MANFYATTSSNDAELLEGKEDEVRRIVEKYQFGDLSCVVLEGTITIYGYDWIQIFPADIEPWDADDVTEEFLKEIAPFLKTPLLIQSVGAEKCRFPLSAQEILVMPNSDLIEWGGFEFREDGSQKI